VDTSRLAARPEGPPLAVTRCWVYDPAATVRARGFSTATLLVYPGLVLVEPRNLPRGLGRVPAARYAWPSVVVQRIVWSYRANFPRIPTILLDIDGELGSAWPSLWNRGDVAATLRGAEFDIIEDVVRGWEAPHPIRLRDHPELEGRLPTSVLVERSWYPDKPRPKSKGDGVG